MERFKTVTGRYDHIRARNLRNARLAAGLSIGQASARLEMPVLRYAMVEAGETDFERPDAWADAMAIVSRPEKRVQR